MSHRYHDNFAPAPVALISGIAATCKIPSIVAARVGLDGSIYLDIFENDDFTLTTDHVEDLADFCGVELDEVDSEDGPGPGIITVVVSSSGFDFGPQYGRKPVLMLTGMPGLEDSEEGIEASVALALSRRL